MPNRLQPLLPGHALDLVGEDDDPLLVAAGPALHDVAIGPERLPPEAVRI